MRLGSPPNGAEKKDELSSECKPGEIKSSGACLVNIDDPCSLSENTAWIEEDYCLRVFAIEKAKILRFWGSCFILPIFGAFRISGFCFKPNKDMQMIMRSGEGELSEKEVKAIDNISDSLKFYPIFSPSKCTALVLRGVNATTYSPNLNFGLRNRLAVLIKKVITHLEDINNYILVGLYSGKRLSMTGFKGCDLEIAYGENVQMSEKSLNYLRDSRKVVLILGDKAVRKSETLKNTINIMLSSEPSYQSIAVIDANPAMLEFSAPGIISLNVISSPVIGPSFSHMRVPRRALFFGSNSSNMNLELYAQIIEDLFETYKSQIEWSSNFLTPLVVNIHNIVKETDIEITKMIISRMMPNIIIDQLSARSSGCHNEILSWIKGNTSDIEIIEVPEYLLCRCKCISANDIRKASIINNLTQNCRDPLEPLNVLNSNSESYWTSSLELVERVPFIVQFSCVNLSFVDEYIKPELAPSAINGVIVALNTGGVQIKNNPNDNTLNVLPSNFTSNIFAQGTTIGIALVRGVDKKTSILYVLTSPFLFKEELKEVKTIIRSTILETPMDILLSIPHDHEKVPLYINRDTSTNLKGSTWHRRFNVLRKKDARRT